MISTIIWLSAYVLLTIAVWTGVYVSLRGIVSVREVVLAAVGSAIFAWLALWLMWTVAGWLA